MFTLSFCAIFLLLFLSSCSASTLRVSDAVALFLRPPVLGTSFLSFDSFFAVLSSSDEDGFVAAAASPFASFSACFRFFLLLPGAFLSACVRPFSLSVLMRRLRRAMSVGAVGAMGMTSFSAKGSLHC